MLTRNTDWRQGDILAQETVGKLGLPLDAISEGQRVVVITHDCDLPNDTEVSVEVIVSDVVELANPQFSYAKKPRRLHLSYEVAGGQPIVIDVRHAQRQVVSKGDFGRYAVRDDSASLVGDEKR